MSKKKQDNRKQLTIRYKIDENRCVSFIDPYCEGMPFKLFHMVVKAISDVEQKWNSEVTNKRQMNKS